MVTALFASSLSFLISPLSFLTICFFLPCSSSTFVPLTFRNYKHVFPFLSVLYRVRGRQDSLLSLMITFFLDAKTLRTSDSTRVGDLLSFLAALHVAMFHEEMLPLWRERDSVAQCNMHCNTHCNTHCNMQSMLDEEKLPHIREKGVLHNTATHTAPHTKYSTNLCCRSGEREMLQCAATHCNAHCNTHCNTHSMFEQDMLRLRRKKCAATHYNTLQHTHCCVPETTGSNCRTVCVTCMTEQRSDSHERVCGSRRRIEHRHCPTCRYRHNQLLNQSWANNRQIIVGLIQNILIGYLYFIDASLSSRSRFNSTFIIKSCCLVMSDYNAYDPIIVFCRGIIALSVDCTFYKLFANQARVAKMMRFTQR